MTSRRNVLLYLWLAALAALSAYYLYRAVDYRFLHADRLGPTLFNKQLWYFSHVLLALPVVTEYVRAAFLRASGIPVKRRVGLQGNEHI